MNTKRLAFIIFILVTLAGAQGRAEGIKSSDETLEVIPFAIDAGGSRGQADAGSTISNDSSYILFSDSSTDAVSEEVRAGFLGNVNNAPSATPAAPADGTITDNPDTAFTWTYADSDGDPQKGYSVQLSTDPYFGVIAPVSSGIVESAPASWTANDIPEGVYYWRAAVKDDPWNEWSVWSSTYSLILDTSAPNNIAVTSLVTYVTSATISASINDICTTAFRLVYSTSSSFEASASTAGAWIAGTVSVSTHTTLPLVPDTTYYFKIEARDALSRTGESPVLQKSTLCMPPAGLAWNGVTDTTISLSWADSMPANPGSTLYIVEISTSQDFYPITRSSQTACGTYAAELSPVTPDTAYYGRVMAVNREGIIARSVISASSATLCSQPAVVGYGDVGTNNVMVSWQNDTTANPASTTYSVDASTSPDFIPLEHAGLGGARSTNGIECGSLDPNTTYYFRVRACNIDGVFTDYTPLGWRSTLALDPGRWSTIAVDTNTRTNTSLNLAWSIITPPENPPNTIYRVEVSTWANFASVAGSSQTTCGAHTALLSGLQPDTSYYARLMAFNWEGVLSTVAYTTVYGGGSIYGFTAPSALAGEQWNVLDSTRIAVTWGAATPHNPPDTRYMVVVSSLALSDDQLQTVLSGGTMYVVDGSAWIPVETWRDTAYSAYGSTVDALTPNTTYYARIIVRGRDGTDYTTSFADARVTLPWAPSNTQWSTTTSTSITVSWGTSVPPNPDNTVYTLHVSSKSDFSIITVSSRTISGAHAATAAGLDPNTTYYARVIATNWEGLSSTSAVSGWRSTLLYTPQSLAWSTAENTSLRITWEDSTPANPEGTVYTVELSTSQNDFYPLAGSSQTVSAAHGATISQLAPNIRYYGRVRASNREGVPLSTVLPMNKSTLVSDPAGIAWGMPGETSLKVVWGNSSPANPDGTTFTVQVASVSGFASIVSSSQTISGAHEATAFGLIQNTTYYARVIATNWEGISSTAAVFGWRSTLVNEPTIAWGIAASTGLRITIGQSSGGNPADTPYTVQVSELQDFSVIAGSSRTVLANGSVLIEPLTPNTTYFSRVMAYNWEGMASTATASTQKATLASIPEGMAWGAVTNSSITITWTDSIPSNPADTAYTVQISSLPGNFSLLAGSYRTVRSALTATVHPLTPNTTYYARLVATNRGNVDTAADVPGSRITKPNIPAGLTYETAITSITVSWGVSTPDNPNDTVYILQASTDSSFVDTVHSSQTVHACRTAAVSGLAVNTVYYLRLIASNWTLDCSTTAVVPRSTRCTVPATPTVATADWNATDNYHVKVTIHANGNPPQTDYSIEGFSMGSFSPITGFIAHNDGDVVTLSGLDPNREYILRLAARDRDGNYSGASPSASTTTAPSPITNLSIVKSTSSMTFSWNVVPEADLYNIYSDSSGLIAVNQGPSPAASWLKQDLTPNTSFGITVEARNSNGKGQYASTSTYTYAEIPGTVYTMDLTSGSIVVALEPRSNSAQTLYLLTFVRSGTTRYVQPDGFLGVSEQWRTYSGWGGSAGITVKGLAASTRYDISALAKNQCGERTEFSAAVSTETQRQFPMTDIISVSTDTVTIAINTNGNSADAQYAIRVVYDGLERYVKEDGTVGAGDVWAGTGTWGGMNPFVVRVSTPSNRHYSFELGCMDVEGNWISNYVARMSTFTLAQTPQLSLVSVGTATVRMSLDTVCNSTYTAYAVKAVLADGTTRYLQAEKILDMNLVFATTSQWQGIDAANLTPAMGYTFSAVAQNGFSVPTDYSNALSTWTAPAVPFAPTVIGGYDDINGNYTQVFINTPNSPYAEYAIEWVENGDYLQSDGGTIPAEQWATEAFWENTTTVRNIHKNRTANTNYSYRVKARSPERGNETTDLSSLGAGSAPPAAPGIPTVVEMDNNDALQVNYLWTVEGAEQYAIYHSTSSSGPYVFVSTVSKPGTSFSHDVDGGIPAAPQSCQATPASGSLLLSWNAVEQPAASLPSYYKMASINAVGAEGQKSIASIGNVLVHPRINGYKVYRGTETLGVWVSTTAMSYSYAGLKPNVTYSYQLAACSTDDLESPKSAEFLTCTLAAIPSNVTAVPAWSESYGYYISLHYDANDNPSYTHYSVKVEGPDIYSDSWLNNAGGLTAAGPVWSDNLSWLHTELPALTTYTYRITAINQAGVQNTPASIEAQSLALDRPILSTVTCTAVSSNREIQSDAPTNSLSSVFAWQVLYTSFTVTGYSISWSTVSADTPDNTAEITVSHLSGGTASHAVTLTPSPAKTYYFKVKALDAHAQVSDVVTFVYRYVPDNEVPVVTPVAQEGTLTFGEISYGLKPNFTYKMQFSKGVSTATLNSDTVYILPVSDAQELAVTGKRVPNLEYDPFTYQLTVTALLEANWTYELVISSNIRDLVDNPMSKEFRLKFRTIMTKDSTTDYVIKAERTPAMTAKLTLPPGALQEDSYVILNHNPLESPLKVQKAAIQEAENKMDRKHIPVWHIEIDRYDINGRAITSELGTAATIDMTYEDANNDGVVDGSTVRAESLSIWHLDEAKRLWIKLPSSIDKTARTVRARARHFSLFMLAGNMNLSVAEVKCFPVPWVPEGGRDITGTAERGIKFGWLPQEGEIFVYTITGELVTHIEFANIMGTGAAARVKWSGKNDDGRDAASGVYLWIVKSTEGKKTGKLVIIR